jgi:hypothetical protein
MDDEYAEVISIARGDAREFARLAALTDRETVKAVLLSLVSGSLVAAKVAEGEVATTTRKPHQITGGASLLFKWWQ